MTEDKKPREWVKGLCIKCKNEFMFWHELNVLICNECSRPQSLESLLATNDALAKENVGYAELNKIQKIYLDAAEKEITSLRESLLVAVEALDHYQSAHYTADGGVCAWDKTADKALAKIKAKHGELK